MAAYFVLLISSILILEVGSTIDNNLINVSLLFLTYLAMKYLITPAFTKPTDHFVSSIGIIGFIVVAFTSFNFMYKYAIISVFSIYIFITILLSSISMMYLKTKPEVSQISYKALQLFSKVEMIYFPLLLLFITPFTSHYLVYLLILTMVVLIDPLSNLFILISPRSKTTNRNQFLGSVLRVDYPAIIRFDSNRDIKLGEEILDINLNSKLYHIIPFEIQMLSDKNQYTGILIDSNVPYRKTNSMFTNCVYETSLNDNEIKEIMNSENQSSLIGFVVENSNISSLKVEIIFQDKIKSGQILYIDEYGERVFYQVIDGALHEEVMDSNPKGKKILSARKIGYYKDNRFVFEPTIPNMNSRVHILSKDSTYKNNINMLGYVPNTSIPIMYNATKLLNFHCAILGTTGTGKTILSLEIIENLMSNGIKVFVIDITGEYNKKLSKLNPQKLTFSKSDDLEKLFQDIETGQYGAANEKKKYYDFIAAEENSVYKQINDFINSDSLLGLMDLDKLSNTLGSLKVVELYIKSIFKYAKMAFENNDNFNGLEIVLEEAHSIIPEMHLYNTNKAEFNSSVQTISQVALQGRKYNVGLLIISQRTALVSKTILSQVNNFFTFSIRDNTSLDFLKNIYGNEDLETLCNLEQYHMLAHGNAINSEKPIIVDTTRSDLIINK